MIVDDYIRHNAGVVGLFSWLNDLDLYNHSQIKNNIIQIPLNMARRFCLGIPKNKSYGDTIFLAVQSKELFWMNNILFKQSFVKYYDPVLYLTTQRINISGLPCIPSFAFAIPFDNAQKAYSCDGINRLDIRGFWVDQHKQYYVEKGKPRKRLRLSQWNGQLFGEEDLDLGQSMRDILNNRIEESNVLSNPGFKGQGQDLSNMSSEFLRSIKDQLPDSEKRKYDNSENQSNNYSGNSPENPDNSENQG